MKYTYILIFLFLFSCKEKETKKNVPKGKVIATIDDVNIYYSDVDELINQQLYDELNRIFQLRELTTNLVIDNKLIYLEAEKKNMTAKNFIDSLYNEKINLKSLKKFKQKNGYEKEVRIFEKNMKYFKSDSDRGKKIILDRFKYEILNDYRDSIRKKYKIKHFNKRPLSPKIETNDLRVHYKGNLDSKVVFLQISDLECSKCREFVPLFNKIYKKYKDKVKFGFTQYGSYQTLSALALEAADNQGKLWEFHDTILEKEELIEERQFFKIAEELNLDIERFSKDFKSDEKMKTLEENFKKLEKKGIYGTPTILINNRMVYNSFSYEEIEEMLEREIGRVLE